MPGLARRSGRPDGHAGRGALGERASGGTSKRRAAPRDPAAPGTGRATRSGSPQTGTRSTAQSSTPSSSRSCSPLRAPRSAPVTRAEPRTRSPTRSPSGAALRCSVCLSPRGRRPRPGGWTRFGSMRLEERFEAALALGEHADLVPGIRAALDESPFRERLWGQLMLALYRSGRQADALDVFQEARRVLMERAGAGAGPGAAAPPGGDPRARPGDRARPRCSHGGAATCPLRRPRSSAAKRSSRQVVELLREHRLVTLTGPPGVGKSRLALEVARSLESELRGGAWHVDLANARRARPTSSASSRRPSTCAAPIRWRGSSRAFVTPTRSSSSTPASTSSRRPRASSRRF